MPSAKSGVEWATAEKWIAFRSVIVGMYIEQEMTLNEVMEKMKSDHNFHATRKMYKRRFEQWGAEKYLRAADVVTALRQKVIRDAVGKQSEFSIRGRKVTARDLEHHLRRNPGLLNLLQAKQGSAENITRSIVCRTPPPEKGTVVYPGKQCKNEEEGHVCSSCLELARIRQERTDLAFSECLRSRLSDVNIFVDCMPRAEFRPQILQEAQFLDMENITLGFDVDWDLSSLVADAATWLSNPQASRISKVGTLSSPGFLMVVEHIVGKRTARTFQHMLYATSLAHCKALEEEEELPYTLMLMDIGSMAGHDLLLELERRLEPQKLVRASKEWFQAYFLLIIGAILSVSYTTRHRDTPAFPEDSSTEWMDSRGFTLWDAKQEHLCLMLAHYLVLLASRLDLRISKETEKVLLGSEYSRWVQDGSYSWNSQPIEDEIAAFLNEYKSSTHSLDGRDDSIQDTLNTLDLRSRFSFYIDESFNTQQRSCPMCLGWSILSGSDICLGCFKGHCAFSESKLTVPATLKYLDPAPRWLDSEDASSESADWDDPGASAFQAQDLRFEVKQLQVTSTREVCVSSLEADVEVRGSVASSHERKYSQHPSHRIVSGLV